MSIATNHRDLEFEYLSLAFQMEDLLQRKTAACGIDSDLQATHQFLMRLGRDIMDSQDTREKEFDYLAAAYKVQDLLQQKSRAYRMRIEFEQLQRQMEDVAQQLGWNAPLMPTEDDARIANRSTRLEGEIQQLRASLA